MLFCNPLPISLANICEAICVSVIYHAAAGTDLARISQLSSLKSTIMSNRLSFNENESTLLQDELIRTLDLPSFFKMAIFIQLKSVKRAASPIATEPSVHSISCLELISFQT